MIHQVGTMCEDAAVARAVEVRDGALGPSMHPLSHTSTRENRTFDALPDAVGAVRRTLF
jgi:hypothetical protein